MRIAKMAKAKALVSDKKGSEAIEMVATTAMMIALIMVGLMILSYAVEWNTISFAAKRVCRDIEVSGQVTDIQSKFDSLIGNSDLITDRNIEVNNVEYFDAGAKTIQLKKTFRLSASVTYNIPLVKPGTLSGFSIQLPIKTSVTGMSEVYWR